MALSKKPSKSKTSKKPARTPRTPASARLGEQVVEFDRYMVVYSQNTITGGGEAWRAGNTLISLYRETTHVANILFLKDGSSIPAPWMDPRGVVTLNYPLSSYGDIVDLLRNEEPLSVLYVENDYDGTPLPRAAGAIGTWSERTGEGE